MTELAMLRLQQELVERGVPRRAVARAMQHIADGGTAKQAYEICAAAMPSMVDTLLLEIQTERLVLQAELAVRNREAVPVIARTRRENARRKRFA